MDYNIEMVERDNKSFSNEYLKLRNLIVPLGFEVSEFINIDYGIQFTIFNSTYNGIVRVYINNKGNKKQRSKS